MEAWSDEGNTDPLPRGGVGDARVKEIKQEETSSCVQTIRQARFSIQFGAARCSDKLEIQEHEEWEMSNEAIDAARRSVGVSEGDPMRYNALARVMQQPALAMLQKSVVVRPIFFRSFRSPRSFRPSAYRVDTPSLSRTRLRCVRCRKLKSCIPGRGMCAPARDCLQQKGFGSEEVCNLTLSDGPIDLRTMRIDSGERLIERATHRLQHSTHMHRGRSLGRWRTAQAAREQNDTKQVRMVAELLVSDRSSC